MLKKPWRLCMLVRYRNSTHWHNTSCSISTDFASWLRLSMFRRITYDIFTDAYHDKAGSALSSLFLALVLYPEVQQRAQAELDTVIARDRLPTFDDRPRLPYINAMCRELMRRQMVTPLGTITDHNDLIRGANRDHLSCSPCFD